MPYLRTYVALFTCVSFMVTPIPGATATEISNPTFGSTNLTHMDLAHSNVSRRDYMKANATLKDDYVLLMFDEIVMSRDEQDGIRKYVDALISDRSRPKILEIGFGMGISAGYIHGAGCSSHTVVEANSDVMKSLVDWRIDTMKTSDCLVTPIFGFWEDVVDLLRADTYDGIMFDPHPSIAGVPFMKEARRLLKVGGKLMFFLSLYHNSSVPVAWRDARYKLKQAGWQDDEIGKPTLSHGSVMADCGHKYTRPGPTEECPFRPLTYIIPDVVKKRHPQRDTQREL